MELPLTFLPVDPIIGDQLQHDHSGQLYDIYLNLFSFWLMINCVMFIRLMTNRWDSMRLQVYKEGMGMINLIKYAEVRGEYFL